MYCLAKFYFDWVNVFDFIFIYLILLLLDPLLLGLSYFFKSSGNLSYNDKKPQPIFLLMLSFYCLLWINFARIHSNSDISILVYIDAS